MKLPDELPDTPYIAAAFRLSHFHAEEEQEDDGEPGAMLLEIAGKLPGTDADIIVPFEMTASMAIELVEELIVQYRCLVHGPPEDDDDTA
jgi:hypothetical protein